MAAIMIWLPAALTILLFFKQAPERNLIFFYYITSDYEFQGPPLLIITPGSGSTGGVFSGIFGLLDRSTGVARLMGFFEKLFADLATPFEIAKVFDTVQDTINEQIQNMHKNKNLYR